MTDALEMARAVLGVKHDGAPFIFTTKELREFHRRAQDDALRPLHQRVSDEQVAAAQEFQRTDNRYWLGRASALDEVAGAILALIPVKP